MGLIQVPRGIQTRRDYAPADIARSAAESAAPWAWRQLVNGRHYMQGSAIDLLTRTPEIYSGSTSIGLSGRGLSAGGNDLVDVIGGERVVTIVAVCTLSGAPSGNHGIESNLDGSNYGWALLADNSDFDSGQTDTFVWRYDVTGSGGSVSTGTGTATAGLHTVVVVHDNRTEKDTQAIWLDGKLRGSDNVISDIRAGGTANAVIGRSDGSDFLGSSDFPGQIHYVLNFQHRWSDAEIQALSADPFALFRRRPLLVPVSSSGGATTDTAVTEAAQGADAWLAVATAPGAITEPAQAAETLSSVAVVGMALTEAVAAQDSDAGPAEALGAVTEAATGNDLADAVAQISAAITAGAAAGESWVAQAQAVVDLVEAGSAGDTVTQGAQDVTDAAVSEGSQAGETFVAAVEAVASLTGASTAADALVAALVAIGSITESAQAGSTFAASTDTLTNRSITHGANASDSQSAVAQILAALTEAIDATALYTASATVAQSIAETVQAGDTWSAVVPGTGYLVASAITITAALSGSINIEPSLSGSVSIKPD